MDAAEVVMELITRFAEGRFAEAYELYAPEAEVSIEFALPERVVVHGTAGWSTTPPRLYDDLTVEDLVVRRTDDPSVVVAEWTYVSRTGEQVLRNGNIIVVEVKDGLVVRSRDYHDHVKRAVADGTTTQLIEHIESMVLDVDRV